ncbi:MAG: methyltransferase [Planctomycetota bacterium]|nr:methyltransferase [Planctomycetota bacterium]
MTSPWWLLKIGVGLALVTYAVLVALGYGPVALLLEVPLVVGQALVLLGAALNLVHYGILKRRSGCLKTPTTLVRTGGLFRYVRHPMYLGDVAIYAGLTLLAPDVIAFGLLALGLVAIERQSRLEDRELGARFGEDFRTWAADTHLLVPGLL